MTWMGKLSERRNQAEAVSSGRRTRARSCAGPPPSANDDLEVTASQEVDGTYERLSLARIRRLSFSRPRIVGVEMMDVCGQGAVKLAAA